MIARANLCCKFYSHATIEPSPIRLLLVCGHGLKLRQQGDSLDAFQIIGTPKTSQIKTLTSQTEISSGCLAICWNGTIEDCGDCENEIDYGKQMGSTLQVADAIRIIVNLSEDLFDHLLPAESTEEPGEVEIKLTKPNSPRAGW